MKSLVAKSVGVATASDHAAQLGQVATAQLKAGLSGTPMLWVSGRYYGAGILSTSSTLGATASRIYLTPLYLASARSIDQIGVNVSTAGTSGQLARMGIYDADPTTLLPVNPLVDSGTFLIDTTGVKTFSTSQTLAGLYWLALTSQGGTFTAWPSSGSIPFITGATSPASPGGPCVVGKDSVNPTSALPVLSSLTYGSVSTPPAVMVRAA